VLRLLEAFEYAMVHTIVMCENLAYYGRWRKTLS
jgi:hypothetical protein